MTTPEFSSPPRTPGRAQRTRHRSRIGARPLERGRLALARAARRIHARAPEGGARLSVRARAGRPLQRPCLKSRIGKGINVLRNLLHVSFPPRRAGRRRIGNTAPVLHRSECLSGARASCPRTRRKARHARAPDDGARLRRERGRDALVPEVRLRVENWQKHQGVAEFVPCEFSGPPRTPGRRRARN